MSAAPLDAGWPAELRGLRSYLPYQLRPRATGRLGKCPARWAGGRLYPVSPRAAEHHLTFGHALELLDQGHCDGIGVVLDERALVLRGQPLAALDLDDVITDGHLHSAAAALLTEFDTYTEVSASGRGLHLVLAGAAPPGARRGQVSGLRVELITVGFLAVTGHCWPGAPRDIASRPAELAGLQAALCPTPPPPLQPRPTPVGHADLLAALLRQRNAAKVERLLLEGNTQDYPSPSEAVYAAARLLAWRTRDAGAIEAVLRASPLYTPRWNRRATAAGHSWITLTVHRALSAHQGAP